jgi:hypothetical protein
VFAVFEVSVSRAFLAYDVLVCYHNVLMKSSTHAKIFYFMRSVMVPDINIICKERVFKKQRKDIQFKFDFSYDDRTGYLRSAVFVFLLLNGCNVKIIFYFAFFTQNSTNVSMFTHYLLERTDSTIGAHNRLPKYLIDSVFEENVHDTISLSPYYSSYRN